MIIAAALIMGPIFFMILVLFLVNSGGGNPVPGEAAAEVASQPFIEQHLFAVLGLSMMVLVAIPIAFFATRILTNTIVTAKVKLNSEMNESEAVQAGFDAYQTATIIRFAVLEGAVIFLLVSYLVSASWLSIVGAVAEIGLMVLIFPWPERTRLSVQNIAESILRPTSR